MTPKQSRSTGRPRLKSQATIRDVAARAGVSVATVSRVLNGMNVVREQTSRLVLDAANALRYVPNTAARALSARRTHSVGVLLPDLHGQFFSEVLRGIDATARSAKYHILVSGWHSDSEEMLDMVNAMHGRVDGLLIMAPDLAVTALRQQLSFDIPVVILNSSDNEHDSVTIDNYGGAKTMMRHLMAQGHTRIAFIKGPQHNGDARERLRGYRQAMRKLAGEQKERPAPMLELEGDFSEESGGRAVPAFLAMKPRPTALFAANDSMAVGAMAALATNGVQVPEEVAVAGFDDIPIARYITPALTTVHVDIADLGRRSFALLLDSMSSRNAHRSRLESIPTSLVVRDSCGLRSTTRKPISTHKLASRTTRR